MSDSPRPLTEEERQAIRAEHSSGWGVNAVTGEQGPGCSVCGEVAPCYAIRLLDLLEQSERENHERQAMYIALDERCAVTERQRNEEAKAARSFAERLEQSEARAARLETAFAAIRDECENGDRFGGAFIGICGIVEDLCVESGTEEPPPR